MLQCTLESWTNRHTPAYERWWVSFWTSPEYSNSLPRVFEVIARQKVNGRLNWRRKWWPQVASRCCGGGHRQATHRQVSKYIPKRRMTHPRGASCLLALMIFPETGRLAIKLNWPQEPRNVYAQHVILGAFHAKSSNRTLRTVTAAPKLTTHSPPSEKQWPITSNQAPPETRGVRLVLCPDLQECSQAISPLWPGIQNCNASMDLYSFTETNTFFSRS
jgi:hypothetical protein